MKLSKKASEIKLADLHGYWRKIFGRFSLRRVREQRAVLSIKTIWVIFLSGLFLLVGLEFILGLGYIFQMNSRLIQSNRHYDRNMQVIHKLRVNLLNLPIIYNEELSGSSARSSKQTFRQVKDELRQLPLKRPGNQDLALLKNCLAKIAGYVSEPAVFTNYYQLWAEVGKARVYLDKYDKQLNLRRQKLEAAALIYRKTLTKELVLLLFVITGAAGLFLLMIKAGKGQQAALAYFEDLMRQFKQGRFQSEPTPLPYQTSELKALQFALYEYLNRLVNRHRIILAKIDEFGPSIQQLAEWITKNDTQHMIIKEGLKNFTNQTYHKLDKFPDLSDQIKNVNNDLLGSQREALELQESIKRSKDSLDAGPKMIYAFRDGVARKGEYFQAVTHQLMDLKQLLDEIQQTVTSFYGISEQTNLLSLNASIEAARAGEAGDNFSIAAVEIEELAVKINKASKDLLGLSVQMGRKTAAVIHFLEVSLSQNKLESKYFDEIVERIKGFITELSNNLSKIEDYSNVVHDFEAEEQALEKLAAILVDLKQQSPDNHARAMAALEIIVESDKLVASAEELGDHLISLKQTLSGIQSELHPEGF